MTFDQLEVLEKIIEHGSFKAAAKALHRTQPTLSIAIKKLEAEFDLTLFSRDAYRPQLTEAGRVFYEWAKQTLQSFRKLEAVGKELGLHHAEPSLTVIIDPVAQFAAVRAIFSECLGAMKATELILRSEIIGASIELIRKGEADFAVTPSMGEQNDIESFPIERVDMIAVIGSECLSSLGKWTKAWLQEQPQIIVASSSELCDPQRREGLGLLDGGKRCFVNDHALKRRLIEEGLGWGRLARYEAQPGIDSERLTAIPSTLAPPFTLELHVMRSRLKAMGPIARSVWSQLQALSRLA